MGLLTICNYFSRRIVLEKSFVEYEDFYGQKLSALLGIEMRNLALIAKLSSQKITTDKWDYKAKHTMESD